MAEKVLVACWHEQHTSEAAVKGVEVAGKGLQLRSHQHEDRGARQGDGIIAGR